MRVDPILPSDSFGVFNLEMNVGGVCSWKLVKSSRRELIRKGSQHCVDRGYQLQIAVGVSRRPKGSYRNGNMEQ